MSCARFPDCKGARTKEGEEIKEKLLGMKCPKCEKGEMVSKMGKFGVFNSCNGYPKCKYVEKYRCPDCNSRMEMKLSKNGTFMSCARFPDCKGARTKEGEEIKEKLLGMKCPKCEKGEMVSKMGKFGVFNSCNGYPKCKYVEENAEEKEKARTGVECPECRKGEIIERKGRFGVFYGCEKYPSCKFTIRAKPTKNNCNICSSIMMEGTKTIPERCSVKTCPMHRPDKLKKI